MLFVGHFLHCFLSGTCPSCRSNSASPVCLLQTSRARAPPWLLSVLQASAVFGSGLGSSSVPGPCTVSAGSGQAISSSEHQAQFKEVAEALGFSGTVKRSAGCWLSHDQSIASLRKCRPALVLELQHYSKEIESIITSFNLNVVFLKRWHAPANRVAYRASNTCGERYT
jgi:hypothetical protein